MHVEESARAAAFVQVVDVLRYDEQVAAMLPVEPPKRLMGRVWLHGAERCAAGVVKLLHQHRIAGEGLRRRDVLHPVTLPQSVRAPESGHAAFGGDACPGQNDDGLRLVCHQGFLQSSNDKWLRNGDGRVTSGKAVRIGVLGAGGRMGQAILAAVETAAGAELGGAVEKPGHPAMGREIGPGGLTICANTSALAHDCDVLVDFTAPGALRDSIEAACDASAALVVGTTGLGAEEHDLIDAAAQHIAVLQTANTSLGVNMLAALVRQAARALGEDWDIEVLEMHHRDKLDAPSGTALMLGEAAAAGRGVQLDEVAERGREGADARREAGAIGFAALRGGSVAGDHQVVFAGEGERLELGHRSESRQIFARGAVRAALWLAGRDPGRYRMADVLGLEKRT